ncbi:fungal-specific transcription factor domain-containing protein [Nemania sp. FL0916]|nr:fungal-specific transcription factor domain-containing protein [Nemania sp. FL0916]
MGTKRQRNPERTRDMNNTERPSRGPVPKRQRVSRACDQCRTSREKCDGIQPLCFPCASQNRQCSWEEPKKKRGVQTGYIRTLEMALGWLFDKIPESEEALRGLLTHEGGQGRMLLAGRDTPAATRLHRRWRKSTVHAEIERVLSGGSASMRSMAGSTPGEESDEDLEKDTSGIFDAKSTPSLSTPADLLKAEAEIPDRVQPRTTQRQDSPTPSKPRSPNIPRRLSNIDIPSQPPRPNAVSLPSNHWRLLDIYFSYTHIWFPILEKHELLKTGYSYPIEGLRITHNSPSSAGHAELWAALALASYQETASRTGGSTEGRHPSPPYGNSREIYHVARSLIPTEDGFFEPRHVNALLLLTLINIACNDLRAAWMLIGVAGRVALSLRLHEDSVATRPSQSSHTYMGCFILDTLLSARLDLTPHLRSGMVYVGPPLLENDLDEWQPWMPCSGFGSPSRDVQPSRMPSHSISSFGILYRIHLVISRRLWDETGSSLQSEDVFLHTLESAVNQYGTEASLPGHVLTGECRTGRLPSMHLLRLVFLYAANMCKGYPHRRRAALACVQSYVCDFGICGLSPLLSIILQLIERQAEVDSLTGDERDRWTQIEKAIASIWTKLGTAVDSDHGKYPQQANTAPGPFSNNTQSLSSPMAAPNPPNGDRSYNSSDIHDPYPRNTNIGMSEFTNCQPPPEHEALCLGGPAVRLGEAGYMDTSVVSPSINFPDTGRPGFSDAALDYDTILDDIAAFERTNAPESDSQFMANLGLRPGTNLADVFSHEFMGFP